MKVWRWLNQPKSPRAKKIFAWLDLISFVFWCYVVYRAVWYYMDHIPLSK